MTYDKYIQPPSHVNAAHFKQTLFRPKRERSDLSSGNHEYLQNLFFFCKCGSRDLVLAHQKVQQF